MKATLVIGLEGLRQIRALPRLMERVYALEARYREGLTVPAIPIRIDAHGALALSRDGNHRLEAARRAGVPEVWVRIDARAAARVCERYGARYV